MKTNRLREIVRCLLTVALVLGFTFLPEVAIAGDAPALDQELVEAAKKSDMAHVKDLLDKGAGPNAIDEYGWTALMAASWRGGPETAKVLIENGAQVNAQNKYGRTALSMAVEMGHANVAKVLLEKGADVNAEEPDGWTAPMYAVNSGRADVVRLLLDKGARFHSDKDWGAAALRIARSNNPEIAKLLRTHRAQTSNALVRLLYWLGLDLW